MTAHVSFPPAKGPIHHRLDHLDGVRALAALYVVGHHIWITTWPGYPRNDGPPSVGWLVYGHLAVSVFIVLSGFSLAIAPSRRGWALSGGTRTFIRRRAWRILPTYWAALILSAMVFGLVTPELTGDKISLKALVVHGLLLQDVINSPKPNGAFWSIAVEWQIYFLFPLILLIRRRLGVLALLATASVCVVGSYLLATHTSTFEPLLNLTPQFALLFVFGVVGATVLGRPVARWQRAALGASFCLGATTFVVLAISLGSVWVDREYFWIDLLVGGATAAALAWMTSGGANVARTFFASFPMRTVGAFSYSVYCVHLPVLWLIWHFGVQRVVSGTTAQFLWLSALGVPTVVAASWLFSLVFEKPFLTHRSFAALRELLRFGRPDVPQMQSIPAQRPDAQHVEK